jgi:hypothetical protein
MMWQGHKIHVFTVVAAAEGGGRYPLQEATNNCSHGKSYKWLKRLITESDKMEERSQYVAVLQNALAYIRIYLTESIVQGPSEADDRSAIKKYSTF